MTKRQVQLFGAGFAVSAILIAAIWGFLVVDISTERYMPVDTGTLFRIDRINEDGIFFSAFGKEYQIASNQFDGFRDVLWEYRGFLPSSVLISGGLTSKAYVAGQEYVKSHPESEEYSLW